MSTDQIRELARKVIESNMNEARDAGPVDISEICEEAFEGLDDTAWTKLARAISDEIGRAQITVTWPTSATAETSEA
jgi:hypothetical protein